jgi:serine/threonine protein kinase/cytochrome c-type biogenesis protein CcmH/NrfG
MLGMIGISGGEILLTLAALLFWVLVVGGIVAIAIVLTRRNKHVEPSPVPPQTPPVAPATQITPRQCPQCGAELKPDVSEGLCPACLLQRGIATEGGAPPGTPPFVPPTIPDLARLFPQLEILKLIGKGGMGAVYKARQPSLDRFVALKILAPRNGGDLDFAERFTREARALAKLSHPNIVGVYDFGQVQRSAGVPPAPDAAGETPALPLSYFIMEYVDGPNLRQIEQAGKLSPRQALEIIPQICAALQFAHDEGIVHRDIKPENVLLDKKGRVKIADFGLAKILGQEPKDFRLTGVRDVVGTPHYMAPEQIEKPQTVDHRADIYSLGVVFYEMLTGELPLGKFQPPSQKAQIDVRLDEVVMRSLEKEPQRRYQHVSEVKTQVETIAQTPAPSSSPAERDESAPSESQSQLTSAATTSPFRRGAQIGFSVFLLIVIAASIITFLMSKDYAGIALVRMTGPPTAQDPYHFQTELEVIQSQAVLEPVAASLNLGQRWGKKFSGGKALSDDETVALMKQMLELQSGRNTALVEIRFHSDSPKEAAEIANKIAETYCARPPEHTGEIIDRAVPPFRPVRPNVPLNIFIGVVAGIVLGIFTGVAVGLFTFWRGRAAQRAVSPPPIQKPDRFWRRFAIVMACVVLIPVAIAILGMLAAIAIPAFVQGRQHAQKIHGQQLAQEGWKLWQARKLDEASVKFNEAVQFAPDDANAWNGLGWAEFNSGKTDEAEKAFQKAVSLEPNHPAALNGLGQIYLSRGNYDEAEKFLHKAASQAPAAWFGLARLYLLEGKFEPAEKWAQKTVDSGQADDVARQMLNAAKGKRLSEGLRLMIEPRPENASPAKPLEEFLKQKPPTVNASAENADQTLAEQPPVVVETQPLSGARDVQPGETEIRVRFSKEMADGSWSWSTAWENSAPEIIGQPHYESDGRTCVAKVKLEPGRTYAWWLNSNKFKNFTDLAGRPAVPYLLIFQTKQN